MMSLRHPFHEDGRCVAVPLNTTYGSHVQPEVAQGQLESAVTVAGSEDGGR